MGILRSILASVLSVFFPSYWFYKPLRDEEDEEDADMRFNSPGPGTGAADRLEPSHSRLRPHSSSRTPGDDATRNRRSWIPSVNLGGLPSWLSWNDRGKDERRQASKSQFEVGRTLPALAEEPHHPNAHIERSKRIFHDRLDLCAETEIIGDCEALNNKINSTVLSIAEEWSAAPTLSRKRRSSANLNVVSLRSHDRDELKSVLGTKLFTLIGKLRSSTSTPSQDLQNSVADAFQVLAISCSFRIISQTLCLGLSREADDEMQETFRFMLSQEPQATALRWRALTYSHSNREHVVQSFMNNRTKQLARQFSAVLVLAGEKGTSPFLSRLTQLIAEEEILESAVQLGRKLKTNFFSAYLDVYMITPGHTYRKDTMDNVDSKKERNAPERRSVSYTLELGVREIPYPLHEGTERILLKPKVVIE